MTEAEIHEVIDLFVSAAVRAEKAGFDGVQIHAAHFFFLSRFISPLLADNGIDSIEVSGNGTSVQGVKAHVDEAYFLDFAAFTQRTGLSVIAQRRRSTESKCVSCNACYASHAHRCVFR